MPTLTSQTRHTGTQYQSCWKSRVADFAKNYVINLWFLMLFLTNGILIIFNIKKLTLRIKNILMIEFIFFQNWSDF